MTNKHNTLEENHFDPNDTALTFRKRGNRDRLLTQPVVLDEHNTETEGNTSSIDESTNILSISSEELKAQIQTLLPEGQWEQVEHCIHQLPSRQEQDDAFSSLAEAHIKQQSWRAAELVIEQMHLKNTYVQAFFTLLDALLDNNQIERIDNILQAVINLKYRDYEKELFNYFDQIMTKIQDRHKINNIFSLSLDSYDKNWLREGLIRALVEGKDWGIAEQELKYVTNPKLKDKLNILLTEGMIQDGLFTQAELKISGIKDINRKVSYEPILAISYDKYGHLDQADARASGIQDKRVRQKTLLQIITNRAETQQWEKVEAIIQQITIREYRRDALSVLRRELPKAQEEPLERILREITEIDIQDDILSIRGQDFVRNQKWDEALKTIKRIDNEDKRVYNIINLGNGLANAQDGERLLHLTQETWAQAKTRGEIFELFRLMGVLPYFSDKLFQKLQNAVEWVDEFLRE